MTPRPIVSPIRAGGEGPGEDAALKAALREALSLWPGGVALVAVREDDEVLALTVNAFASVSQNPPLVLVCIGEHAGILPSLLDAGRFTVSLLAEGQKRLAAAFADKLPPPDAGFGAEGDPVPRGAVASLACSVWESYPGGDHRIVVGLVERVELGHDEAPLVYHRRRYRGIG